MIALAEAVPRPPEQGLYVLRHETGLATAGEIRVLVTSVETTDNSYFVDGVDDFGNRVSFDANLWRRCCPQQVAE